MVLKLAGFQKRDFQVVIKFHKILTLDSKVGSKARKIPTQFLPREDQQVVIKDKLKLME